jgi:xylono-1,5-lactonase
MKNEVECIWPLAAQLAEGPMWSANDHQLWFVDIKSSCIHSFHEKTGEKRTFNTPEYSAFIFPASDGKFICGLRSGLYKFDPMTEAFSLLTRVDAEHPNNRLNDGYVDAVGRLWFGTMDNNEVSPSGSLYRYSRMQLKRVDSNYVITNGPTMNPVGTILYHVDSKQQIIYTFDVDAPGELSNKRELVRIEERNVFPDGPAVDANGNLWIALFGGWGVRCYSPQGTLLHTINVPVANCTKIGFGGEDLKTMYITTAWVGLSDKERKQQPLAGGLFRVRVAVAGIAQNVFVV